MTQAELVTKKWGNSIGIVIPKKIVDELGLQEGRTVIAQFKTPKKTVLEELYEAAPLKGINVTTEELLAQYRKENPISKWI